MHIIFEPLWPRFDAPGTIFNTNTYKPFCTVPKWKLKKCFRLGVHSKRIHKHIFNSLSLYSLLNSYANTTIDVSEKYKKLETTELYTNTDRHPAEYKTCMIPNIRTSILLLFLFAAAAFIHAIYISLGFLLVLCNTWWVSVCYLHILFADFCYSVGIVYVSALLCFPNGRARFFWENRFFFYCDRFYVTGK